MIGTLLIANRGEIACRIIRTARRMGIRTVAVYADPDAAALHVAEADLAVPLRGTAAVDTYLHHTKLLAAGERSGADAIHPGYGFLAENASFARAVQEAGLVWVGPSPDAIALMGDKLAAKERMAAAGVPVLKSVSDPRAAADLDFPVIVKAAAGGGGKGMRVVADPGQLDEAVAAARRESAAAFGDDTVFIERYVTRPRHVEVQVLGDRHGNLVHLGERECSLQRRHQKVVEEAPSPLVDASLREELGAAAVAAARAVDYVGAGTVEFVATQEGDFFFLEMNTRLQVEHPVTEEAWRVRGVAAPLDLVREQLRIADGAALGWTQDDLELVACSVEARLYAEDPAQDFLPASGTVALLEPADLQGTRWDSGVRTGDAISPYYDPLIAKVIATAPTRPEAAALLALELERTRLHGLVTNRDALVALLRHPAFVAGRLHTGFIAEHLVLPGRDEHADHVHVVAATLAAQAAARFAAPLPGVPSGWRNNPAVPQQRAWRLSDGEDLLVRYFVDSDGLGASVAVTRLTDGDDRLVAAAGQGQPTDQLVVLHAHAPDLVDLEWDGLRTVVRVTPIGDGSVGVDSPLGHTSLRPLPRFPEPGSDEPEGSLAAPMPGSVVSVAVAPGDVVAAGDLLLVLEAMKMEHRVTAHDPGTVTELRVAPGDQVAAGDILAVIE